MNKWINWFEIPATDFDRANKFYSGIFGIELYTMEMMGTKMAIFPTGDKESGGAVVQGDGYVPSMDGSVVYLNGGKDLTGVLSKVEANGGKMIVPKTHIGDEMGYFAMFIDTEGNKVALHSIQ